MRSLLKPRFSTESGVLFFKKMESLIMDSCRGKMPGNDVTGILAAGVFLCLFMFSGQAGAREGEPHWLGPAREAVTHARITDPANAMASFERGSGRGEFIVNLKSPPEAAEIDEPLQTREQKEKRRKSVHAARDRAFSRMPDFPADAVRHRYDNIFAFSVEVTPAELKRLLDNPDVETVEPVIIAHPHLAQGIPLEKADTYRSRFNGQGLSVAICDSGIDYNNPYLGGGGFPNAKVIGGYDVGQNDSDPMDGLGHGTACAGIAAGALAASGDYIGGVAYNARLYALKMSETATEGHATSAAMVAAWDWSVTHQNDNPNYPILIISTSYGSGKYTRACDTVSPAMTSAAIAARAAGITVFASTGNDGYCDAIAWPGCISHVVSVGAVHDAAYGTKTWCISGDSCAPSKAVSSTCTSGWYATDQTAADRVPSYSNTAGFINLLAPADRAYTLGIGGSTFRTSFGGTSAACPYAAGAAAALQSAAKAETGSWLTPEQVKSRLTGTGDSVTDGKTAITKPRVDLRSAIRTILPVVKKANPAIVMLLFDVCTVIPNGNFESGNTDWTEYSSHGWQIIMNTGFPSPVVPHGGAYAAWLGGDYDDTSYVEQQTTISPSCPFLTFYHWIASADTCGFDHGYVRVNGVNVASYELCESTGTGGWVAKSIDLGAYAGQTVTLQIRTETDASLNSNWFIDDISFRSAVISAGAEINKEADYIPVAGKGGASSRSSMLKKR